MISRVISNIGCIIIGIPMIIKHTSVDTFTGIVLISIGTFNIIDVIIEYVKSRKSKH